MVFYDAREQPYEEIQPAAEYRCFESEQPDLRLEFWPDGSGKLSDKHSGKTIGVAVRQWPGPSQTEFTAFGETFSEV